MKDINKPIRLAFWNLLNGNLDYEGVNVPVTDELLNTNSNYYVLLTNQTATPDETKTSFDAEATMTIDIVTKTGKSVTKDIADDIANQILTLLRPSPALHGLIPPPDWQFLNLRKSDDRYMPASITGTSSIVRRIMQFSFRVVQN